MNNGQGVEMSDIVDEQTRKSLFNNYSGCKWMQVSKEGKVVCCSGIVVEYVSVDKDGAVHVAWRSGAYSQLKTSRVNAVGQTEYGECIQGIFTSQEEAVAVARDWFQNEKLKKIKQLEEELAKLKAECKQ